MKSMEDELVERYEKEELKKAFPNYKEYKTIKEGRPSWLCKLFGHKVRVVHYQFYTEKTERGKEWYECYICPRCKDVEGKLVRITEEKKDE